MNLSDAVIAMPVGLETTFQEACREVSLRQDSYYTPLHAEAHFREVRGYQVLLGWKQLNLSDWAVILATFRRRLGSQADKYHALRIGVHNRDLEESGQFRDVFDIHLTNGGIYIDKDPL